MPKPTTRVLAVLELLQNHGRMSGRELAERLEVDGRTLRRYIATLEELGIPIYAERGRYGGYALVAGFKLPPMMFTPDEALAVSLGLAASRGLGLADVASAAQSAQAKLERVLPAPLQQRMRALLDNATLDTTPAAAHDNLALLQLSTAAQARQQVALAYRNEAGVASRRVVDPYGLVLRRGRWYLVGHCHLRQDVRTFRLDRIDEAVPLPASFGRPETFDAARHLAFSIATLPRATPVSVLLHTDLAGAVAELGDQIGLLLAREDGVLLHARTDSLNWLARQLARLPFSFEVQEPPALREALAAWAQHLLRLAR
ncbi:YafY family transcriptional regulator [Chitiniphilus purpureus]|uniref:YafY family transcriptional regulator n=1 Tax=Chitiniphilus purpureus TaxID=2981137 RepID=A0ABY6DIB7_9NEIS|nr:YafY family protein [Chitiniphilus sp. CD1]UXY14067.1 YafY family transcriptional regulator [Chitiniphilus sp. CD1]